MWYFIAGVLVGLLLNYASGHLARWESRRKINKLVIEFEDMANKFKQSMDEVQKQRQVRKEKDTKSNPIFFTPGDFDA